MLADADALEQFVRPRDGGLAASAERLAGGERDILDDRHVRVELEALEHHADARAQLRQVRPAVAHRDAVHDDAAGVEAFQPVDAFDERALAGPRGTAHHHDLAAFDT